MKRVILCVLSLSLIIQLIIPVYANAKSPYDDVIKTTPNLYLPKIRDNGRDCSDSEDKFGDISDNYMYFLERAVNRTRPQYKEQLLSYYREFRSIVDTENGGYWAILQKDIDIVFAFSKTDDFNQAGISENGFGFQNKANHTFKFIHLSDHRGCNYRPLLYTGAASDQLVTYSYLSLTKDYKFFVNNFPFKYPPGYEGIRIDNLKPKEKITPSVSYNVSGLKLDAYLCWQNSKDSCKAMAYPWGKDTKFKYEIKNNPTDQKPIYSSGDLSLADAQHFSYTFDKKGKYYLILQYVYPGTPFPDLRDKYNFQVLNLPINIDGSSYFSGTKSQNCENGSCKDYSPFKDCSSLNIIQAIGCHLENFGTSLKSYLTYLFIPDVADLKDYFKGFTNQISKSLGFLWIPFDFTIGIFKAVINFDHFNTDCQIPYGIKLCTWRTHLPHVWSTFQKTLQISILVMFIFAYWRKIANIFGMDKSEEAKE